MAYDTDHFGYSVVRSYHIFIVYCSSLKLNSQSVGAHPLLRQMNKEGSKFQEERGNDSAWEWLGHIARLVECHSCGRVGVLELCSICRVLNPISFLFLRSYLWKLSLATMANWPCHYFAFSFFPCLLCDLKAVYDSVLPCAGFDFRPRRNIVDKTSICSSPVWYSVSGGAKSYMTWQSKIPKQQ